MNYYDFQLRVLTRLSYDFGLGGGRGGICWKGGRGMIIFDMRNVW